MTVVIDSNTAYVEPYSLNFLDQNRVYSVLCIEDGWYRILNNGMEPTLYDYRYFNVVDHTIDSRWIIEIDKSDKDTAAISYLGPKELSSQCFFEELFDSKIDTINIFLSYMNRQNITLSLPVLGF